MKNKVIILSFVMLLSSLVATAQPVCTITRYGEDDGLSQWRISQMLQDKDGMLWFSTWNGLDRFDGYEFVHFKSRPGDKVLMPTDRLRDMRMSEDGTIYVMADTEWFRFNRQDGTFDKADKSQVSVFNSGITGRQAHGCINRPIDYQDRNGVEWHISEDGSLSYKGADSVSVAVPTAYSLRSHFYMVDHQDNLWLFGDNGIFRLNFILLPSQRLQDTPAAQGSCAYLDAKGNYWLTTRSGQSTVQLFDCHNTLLGYLNSSGHLQQSPVEFGFPIYCIRQMRDGTLWMGSKPGGLFRLRPMADRQWHIDRFSDLPCTDVYDIVEDARGRLWVATMGGGILVCEDKNAENPHFIELRTVPGYPKTQESKVRRLHITHEGILLAATTEGLMVGRIPKADVRTMTLRLHQREANRATSLSSNATMDILETLNHRIFIATESGGICEIGNDADLLASSLDFRHYNTSTGLNSDVTFSLANIGNTLWIVGSNQLMRLNIDDGTFDFLDSHFFHESFRFSECRPLHLDDGRWIIGVSDGFISLSDVAARKSMYRPPIVLTAIDKQGKGIEYSVNHLEAITLDSDERSLIIHFAAIDTDNPDGIVYAFKMEEDPEWNYIGHSRSASFAGLKPGTYHLLLRSTNADGVWVDNIRTLEIIVKPTFFEAWYGQLLILLGFIGIIGAVIYTYLYIRRIKREQKETLRAYLELIGRSSQRPQSDANEELGNDKEDDGEAESIINNVHLSPDDEAFMSRIVAFVEQNIGDSDASVNDMAEAAAVSRSGLNRKMKALVGLTPADFLREARIKRACQLLRSSDRSVSDIAFACGFGDPKYFTKCFRSSVGIVPTEYRSQEKNKSGD